MFLGLGNSLVSSPSLRGDWKDSLVKFVSACVRHSMQNRLFVRGQVSEAIIVEALACLFTNTYGDVDTSTNAYKSSITSIQLYYTD